MKSKFSQRLLELRQERKLSQDAVAKAIGVSQKAVDFWEKDISEPKLSYILKLASFFGVTCDYLMGAKED